MSSQTATQRLKQLLHQWNLMYVVAYIIAETELDEIPSNSWDWQNTFREIKKRIDRIQRELLRDIVYSTKDGFSRELERARSYLIFGRFFDIPSLIVGDPQIGVVNSDVKQSILQESKKLFTPQQIRALDRLAKRVRVLFEQCVQQEKNEKNPTTSC